MKVLIVEDEPWCVDMVRRILKPFATSIHFADNISDCFQYLERVQFDLIVLDLKLKDSTPDNTIDCIGEILALQANAGVIVMSEMMPETYFRKRSIESGAMAFLSKSEGYTTNSIVIAIASVVRKTSHSKNDLCAQAGVVEEISKIAV